MKNTAGIKDIVDGIEPRKIELGQGEQVEEMRDKDYINAQDILEERLKRSRGQKGQGQKEMPYQDEGHAYPITRTDTISRAIELIHRDKKPQRTDLNISNDISSSISKIRQNIDIIVDEYNKLEKVKGSGLIKRLLIRLSGSYPSYSEGQIFSSIENTLVDTGYVFGALINHNEMKFNDLSREYKSITQRITKNIDSLCSLQQDISKECDSLEDIEDRLDDFRGRDMDFSKPDEVKEYHILKDRSMNCDRVTSQKVDDYLIKLNQLKSDKDTAACVLYWSQINNMQQLCLKRVKSEAESAIEEVGRQKQLYGSIAATSDLMQTMYHTVSKIKKIGDNKFVDNIDSVTKLQKSYTKMIEGNELSFKKKENDMLNLMEKVKSVRETSHDQAIDGRLVYD